jgi:hypothetical protein
MNITLGKYIIISLVLIFIVVPVRSEQSITHDSTYRFFLVVSGGYSASADSNLFKGNFSPSVRIMWEPDHRLNIGVEGALINLERHSIEARKYELGTTDFDARLIAAPVLLVFSMEVWGADISGGMGTSYIWTQVDAFNDVVISSQWNYSLMCSLGYTLMFTDNFGLGLESKSYFFTELSKIAGSLQLNLKFNILEW